MPETDAKKIGRVTRERFDEIVAELRAEVREDHRIQFVVGDRALEVEPMRRRGGSMPNGDDDLFTVSESLHLLSEETGILYSTIERHRWTAFEFVTSKVEPAPTGPSMVVAAEAQLVTEAGECPGEVLVFTQGGYLSWLEVCSWSDDIEVTLAAARHWLQTRS
ncbi:hypothetical protein [Streptomyces sp. NPDC020951]|uniref:hypothetical protein n=1 Tax=Streptomyces sp. NPDC020951 TaxID=3365104 RepID=UPI0037AF4EC2